MSTPLPWASGSSARMTLRDVLGDSGEGLGVSPSKRPFSLSNQILQEMMKEMDRDGSGCVSLAEWVRAGATTVPLLVLLRIDMVSGKGFCKDGSSAALKCTPQRNKLSLLRSWHPL